MIVLICGSRSFLPHHDLIGAAQVGLCTCISAIITGINAHEMRTPKTKAFVLTGSRFIPKKQVNLTQLSCLSAQGQRGKVSREPPERRRQVSTAAAEYFARIVTKLKLNPYSSFLHDL